MSIAEDRAIRAALRPDTIADYARNCHVAAERLVDASQIAGSDLAAMWHGTARVARGICSGVPGPHSWVVIGGFRIVDITLWSYDESIPEIHRSTVVDSRYIEPPPIR